MPELIAIPSVELEHGDTAWEILPDGRQGDPFEVDFLHWNWGWELTISDCNRKKHVMDSRDYILIEACMD